MAGNGSGSADDADGSVRNGSHPRHRFSICAICGLETHTGLGFAGAGTPTSAGGGYVYLRNRWYDPQTGRFLSQDPIGLAGGVNLYAYAGNNPASFSDPFGLCPPEDSLPCPKGGRVDFMGFTGSAFLGAGATVGVGVYQDNDEAGFYLRVGAGPGFDLAAGGEAGTADSKSKFGGGGFEAAGGAFGVGPGVAIDKGEIVGKSGSLTVGTRDLPVPVSSHAAWNYTLAVPVPGADGRSAMKASWDKFKDEVRQAVSDAATFFSGVWH